MVETAIRGLFNFIEELRKYTEWDKEMELRYRTADNLPSFKLRMSSMQQTDRVELSRWKDRLNGMQDVLEIEERQLDAILESEKLRHPLRVLTYA